MASALAVSEVNASMGRIIATPTAGSCGIIPGVFIRAQQRFHWSDEHRVMGCSVLVRLAGSLRIIPLYLERKAAARLRSAQQLEWRKRQQARKL